MLHPDKFPQGSKQCTRAHEKMQEVNGAWQILKDVEKRAQYDYKALQQDSTPSEESHPFTPRPSQSASTLQDVQLAPPPATPQPKATVQPVQRDSSGEGCVRSIFCLLGVGCLLAILVNVLSDSAREFGVWNYAYMTVMGLGFLLAAFARRKKP